MPTSTIDAALERTQLHFGEGALSELPAILDDLNAASVFLVLDEKAAAACGFASDLDRLLESFRVTCFNDFEPNPKLGDVESGVAAFRAAGSDAVVAFGGGTSIDVAKLVGAIATQSGAARGIATGTSPLVRPGPPLVAIPTTAGTGSEATHFAVVYVDGSKKSVAHENLLPVRAIVDPRLTYQLPPRLTAASGLDAFCQAVESIWAVGATKGSVVDATAALRLAFENLERSVHAPDPSSRAAMCRAAHLAGRAINVSKTTLCHALSYPITSGWGIPHGEAVALTLASTLRFNAGVSHDDCNDPRGPDHVRERLDVVVATLGADSIEDAARRVETFVSAVAGPITPRDCGIRTENDVDSIVDRVDVDRLSNNPRRPTKADLARLLGRQSD